MSRHSWSTGDKDASPDPHQSQVFCLRCGAPCTTLNEGAECRPPRCRPPSCLDDPAAIGTRMREIRAAEGREIVKIP